MKVRIINEDGTVAVAYEGDGMMGYVETKTGICIFAGEEMRITKPPKRGRWWFHQKE